MGTLEDALRKSGLVSKKQAKQARHQKRVHRKEVGREGLEAERLEKERAHREAAEAQKQADRRLEAERAAAEVTRQEALASSGRGVSTRSNDSAGANARSSKGVPKASLATIGDSIYRGKLGRVGGPKQYFFVLPGGQIPHLEVNDETFRRLQDGGAGIVCVPSPEGEPLEPLNFVVVDRATAVQVRTIAPACAFELQPERTFGDSRGTR